MERGKRTSARMRMRTPLRNENEKLAGYLRRLFGATAEQEGRHGNSGKASDRRQEDVMKYAGNANRDLTRQRKISKSRY